MMPWHRWRQLPVKSPEPLGAAPPAAGAVALSELAPGGAGLVLQLDGGQGLVGRLAALGFTPGSVVRVLRNDGHGPLLVQVMDSQIALGRGQAARVWVRPQAGSSA